MSTSDVQKNRHFKLAADDALLLTLVLAKLLIHLATNAFAGYGYIRDELYYLACSDHMAWGYVDHPPLSIAVLWLSRRIFGDSLFALRLMPALSGAAVVWLMGRLTSELGGGRRAVIVAGCCVIASPLVLGMDSIFSMNSFDVLFWTLALYFLVRSLKHGKEKHWVLLGVALGFGLLNKISVLWLGAGLAAGLILTPHRAEFRKRGVWLAAIVALLLFAPHVIWQIANGYPTLEFIRNAGSGKYAALSPLELFAQQALFMNPIAFPIWFSGFLYFLFAKAVRPYRILPIIYAVVFLILAVNKNVKAAYLVVLIPMLFALGGVVMEKFVHRVGWRWLTAAVVSLVVLSGAALAPLVLAVLPPETYIAYGKVLGMVPATSESNKLGRLPQHYADMFGWPEMAGTVARVYNTLTPEERSKCAILCGNYGEAGAIDFFGRARGLPGALSGHNNYWLWGMGNDAGEVVLRLGGSATALQTSYEEVTPAAVISHDYSMPYESDLTVWICKKRRRPLKDDWLQFKVYN